MKQREYRNSILYLARLDGYCEGNILVFLNLALCPDNNGMEGMNLSERKMKEMRFDVLKKFAPDLTWEMCHGAANDESRKGFAIAQHVFPELTEEMCEKLAELRQAGGITYDYVNNHIDVFKDSPLWERLSDQFLEIETQKDRERNVQWALEFFSGADADNEKYGEDAGEGDPEGFAPVLLWRNGSRDEDGKWRGGTFDERFELAKRYLKLPDMDIGEAGDVLRNTDPEQEVAVRCGNAVAVGCQEDGYNHFYIGRANPKRPWIIKHYARSYWELIGYVETNEYGYLTDKCLK